MADKRPMFVISAMAYGSTSFFSSVTVFLMTVMSIERWLHMSDKRASNLLHCCDLVNRAAWGRRAVLVLYGVYFFFFFSFVGELTKTSARPSAGRDFESRNL